MSFVLTVFHESQKKILRSYFQDWRKEYRGECERSKRLPHQKQDSSLALSEWGYYNKQEMKGRSVDRKNPQGVDRHQSLDIQNHIHGKTVIKPNRHQDMIHHLQNIPLDQSNIWVSNIWHMGAILIQTTHSSMPCDFDFQ